MEVMTILTCLVSPVADALALDEAPLVVLAEALDPLTLALS